MSARSSRANRIAMLGACVFAVVTGVNGHLYLSIVISLLGAALCITIISKEPLA